MHASLYRSCCAAFGDFQTELLREISRDLGTLFDELADASAMNADIRAARLRLRRINGPARPPRRGLTFPRQTDTISVVFSRLPHRCLSRFRDRIVREEMPPAPPSPSAAGNPERAYYFESGWIMMKENGVLNRYNRRLLLLCIAFAVTFFGSFLLGRYGVSLKSLLAVLTSRAEESSRFTATEATVVRNIRLPRIVVAALVGAALSVAGASYQGMFRNPMVSPDLLGASTGAGFGAALGILLGFGYFGITLMAFCFGLCAVALACLVSRASRLGSTVSMVLAGVMIGSLFSAGTSFIKYVADTEEQLPAITYWLMGSLSAVKRKDMLFALFPILLPMVPLLLLRWRINLLTLSEAEARAMGVNTRRLRLTVIACATLMTSAAVSVSGMIGWVGLVIPHFCRMIFGCDYRRILPASVLLGSTFLMLVDDIARILTAGELPIGILTSFVGAPVFLYLILVGGEHRES